MANSLASLGNGNCIEPFPNGTEGQVLTMDGGQPVWQDPSSGVSTDGSNILSNGSDGKAYLTCEDIQDCVGLAIANGTGLTYDDALNAISATGVPIVIAAGLPTPGTLNTPVIQANTDDGNVYYRDPAGQVLRLTTEFNVTAGPDATTVTSGPFPVTNGDLIHFWGNTIGFTVTPGSAYVEAEVALSTDANNALTTGTDGKLYASTATGGISADATQLLSLGSDSLPFLDCAALAGCSIDALKDVDTTTTAPATGDLLSWDGTNWVPVTKSGEKTTFGTETGNGPASPTAPATAPASPVAGDQYVEAYADKILIWEYAGAAWVLRTTIPIAAGVNIYSADGTLTANRTMSMDGKSLTLENTTAVDTGIGVQNPNGTGHVRIDPSGDLEIGNSSAGGKIQLQTVIGTVAQVRADGTFEIDGDGTPDQSGLQLKHLLPTTAVTASAAPIGVDATGNVVIAPTALEQICAVAPVALDTTKQLRLIQEGTAGCDVVEVNAPDCATATPASVALGYNGTGLGFFAMRERIPVRTVTASGALNTLTDGVLVVDATTGDVTVTLPTPGNCHPNHFYVKRTDTSANTVTLSSAANIDGAATKSICNADALIGDVVHIVWTGSTWITL